MSDIKTLIEEAKKKIEDEKYLEALELGVKALDINPKSEDALLQKGIANFHLKNFKDAKENFNTVLVLNVGNETAKMWIKKCDDEMNSAASPNPSKEPETVPMPSGPKTKYDWYQTETHVFVSIMVKNAKKEDCTINIQDNSLSATIKQSSGTEYSLELDLAHQINAAESSYRVGTVKIEVKMKKIEGIRWNKLEGEDQITAKQFKPGGDSTGALPKYPTSSTKTKDWDKLAAEIKQEEKDEKLEGDQALNSLFQKIYADGNDETKKAMMKSFYESGGTVLSTNWNEIGDKKTDVKPPDGMEFKQWNS